MFTGKKFPLARAIKSCLQGKKLHFVLSLYIYSSDSQESNRGAIHRTDNHLNLLLEINIAVYLKLFVLFFRFIDMTEI